MYLEREDYQVEAVGDGRSALEAVDRLQPELLVLVSLRVNLSEYSNAFIKRISQGLVELAAVLVSG